MSAAVVTERAHPRPIPPLLIGVCAALVALGAVAFVAGLSSDSDTAWRAFHVNYLYFGLMGQAGVVVARAFVIVGARPSSSTR